MVVVVEEKEMQWSQMVERCRRVVDKLGLPIDEGIFEAVVALNLLGIHTCASCEGHPDRGAYAPWIDIQTPGVEEDYKIANKAFDHYQEQVDANKLSPVELGKLYAHTLQLDWKFNEKALSERNKLIGYLARFYENRHSPYDRILTIQHRTYSARLESQGAYFQRIAPDERRVQKLVEYQEEMHTFTVFLKELFFFDIDKQ